MVTGAILITSVSKVVVFFLFQLLWCYYLRYCVTVTECILWLLKVPYQVIKAIVVLFAKLFLCY